MTDFLYNIANLVLAVSICSSLYLRLKYRRFGHISWWWEKLGWLLMSAVIFVSTGNFINSFLSENSPETVKESVILLAAYFGWYAGTIYWVTKKKKKTGKKK